MCIKLKLKNKHQNDTASSLYRKLIILYFTPYITFQVSHEVVCQAQRINAKSLRFILHVKIIYIYIYIYIYIFIYIYIYIYIFIYIYIYILFIYIPHFLIMFLLFAKHHIKFFLIVMYGNFVYQKCFDLNGWLLSIYIYVLSG